MKLLKIILIIGLIYIGIVVTFESLLGYFQPANDGTLVITTTDEDSQRHERVLARIVSSDQLYVAANHWPRAWFTRIQDHPNVEVTYQGETTKYLAVPVSDAEHDSVNTDKPLPLFFRILTGFPPRYFMRLDPKA